MAAVAADVAICQKALRLIGADPITSFTESTLESQICSDLYEEVKEAALSDFPWGFAKGKQDLARLVAEPLDEWSAAYAMPGTPEVLWVETVAVGDYPIPYEIFENQVYCNASETDTVTMTYVFSVDEGRWPPYFRLYVIFRMAEMLATALTRRAELANQFNQQAEIQFARARARDSMANTSKKIRTTRFITTRR